MLRYPIPSDETRTEQWSNKENPALDVRHRITWTLDGREHRRLFVDRADAYTEPNN
jgi:hypothetical protein